MDGAYSQGCNLVVGHFHGGFFIETDVGAVYICLVMSLNLPAM